MKISSFCDNCPLEANCPIESKRRIGERILEGLSKLWRSMDRKGSMRLFGVWLIAMLIFFAFFVYLLLYAYNGA